MKLVLKYRGMSVKALTKRDIGPSQEYKLGEMIVFNEQGDEEYDGIETIEIAKELIDGLKEDRKKLKKPKSKRRR